VRLQVAATVRLWFDEGTVGAMGLHVLGGRFPFFFYGQPFMGAADAYLDAVPFAIFGASTLTLRLWPILLSFGHAGLAGLLARRVFGTGRWATGLVLLPSPFLLKWSHDARLHYDLLLVLTPLLLLLALAGLDPARPPVARTRAVLVFALVTGVGWWVNLLVALLPVTFAIALVTRRPRLRPAAWMAAPAFVLGSAPFWLFAVWRGRLAATTVPLVSPAVIARHAGDLLTHALPIVVGVPDVVLGGRLATVAVGGALGLFGFAVFLVLGHPGASRDGRLVLGALGLFSLVAVLVTERGLTLGTEDPRYLLPLLAVLPVLWAGMIGRLAGSRPTFPECTGLLLLVAHGVGLAAADPSLVFAAPWPARSTADAVPRQMAQGLAARGITAVYTHEQELLPLTFVSGEHVVVSHLYEDADPLRARRVDGAAAVAYLGGRVPPGFDAALAAAGIRFARERTSLGTLYTAFELAPDRHREISPAGWTATASLHPEMARWALDRDAATAWRSGERQRPGMWFQVDLGRVHPVGMVTWLPGAFQEGPTGFRVEASLDGVRWRLAREASPSYGPLYWSGSHPIGRVRWGRVEVRFPARPARYLRITQLGENSRLDWSIRELFVYEVTDGPATSPAGDPAPVATALRRRGVTRVYADHGVGARLAEASGGGLAVLPGNLYVDAYGSAPPVNELPRFRAPPGTAVVYPADLPSGETIAETLRRAGWRFADETLGGYRVLTEFTRPPLPGSPLTPRGWRITGEPGTANPGLVVDGRLETRWWTQAPQRPGAQLQVDFPEPVALMGVDLDLGAFPADYPRGLAVEVSGEPGHWERLDTAPLLFGRLRWAGLHVLRDGVERVSVRFPPVRARGLRLVQTGSDPVFPWSVAELRLVGP
jgi:F5/8 type C domain